jgi:CRP/FNR family cyclic AMP-dependent transcriptional regulator
MRKKHTDIKMEVLRSLPFFHGARAEELSQVARLVTRVKLPAGHVMTGEGEVGKEAFIIVSGHAEATIGGEVVGTVGPGDIVGEMSLLDGEPRSATITTISPIDAFVANAAEFYRLMTGPKLSRAVLRQTVGRLRAVEGGAS